MKISTTQPAEAIAQSDELKRDLGLTDCALLVIGSVIGSGIFLTPGNIARTVESVQGVFLVWVAGGILSLFGALAYAEFSHVPRAGGIYVSCVRPTGPHGVSVRLVHFFVMQSGSVATLALALQFILAIFFPCRQGRQLCAIAMTVFDGDQLSGRAFRCKSPKHPDRRQDRVSHWNFCRAFFNERWKLSAFLLQTSLPRRVFLERFGHCHDCGAVGIRRLAHPDLQRRRSEKSEEEFDRRVSPGHCGRHCPLPDREPRLSLRIAV